MPLPHRTACMALAALLGSPLAAHAARADDDPAQQCEAFVKRLGFESSENYAVRYFVTPKPLCKDKASVKAFCGFVQSFDGFKTLADDAPLRPDESDPDYPHMTQVRERAARLCGTTTEAIRASLCGQADAARQWDFAYAECPAEGRRIFVRECQKPVAAHSEGAGRTTLRRTEGECAAQFSARSKVR